VLTTEQAVGIMSPVVYQYRLVGTSGSEIALIWDERPQISEDESVTLPDGSTAIVLEIYDGEHGTEGGVVATLVVED
jgi:hypothetical protein